MATNVFTNDANLVALYRFETFPTDGQLLNLTTSSIYTGLNTMQISGTPTQDSNIPSQVEGGSGVKFEGATDLFHLHMTSGNESGISSQSGSQFTVGFFGRPSVHASTRSWISHASSQSSGAYWRIESNALGVGVGWRFVYGVTSGTSSLAVASPWQANTDQYESVIITINGTNNCLYVSGVLSNSGALQYSPGPSGSSGILIDLIDVPFRLGAHRAFSSQAGTNHVGIESGLMAEAFILNRVLSESEIAGVAASGIRTPTIGTQTTSDALDTTKDSIGAINPASPPELRATLWDATDGANPSGFRHIQSGSHPAFIKIVGGTSGIQFTNARQGTASDPIAITIRNMTSGTDVRDMKVWLQDYSSFTAINGWEISQRIKSQWTPNLSMSSGAGVMGRGFAAASSVLRSDLGTNISGNSIIDATSGEPQISQYIYVAFETNDNFVPATYGASGFGMRVSAVY